MCQCAWCNKSYTAELLQWGTKVSHYDFNLRNSDLKLVTFCTTCAVLMSQFTYLQTLPIYMRKVQQNIYFGGGVGDGGVGGGVGDGGGGGGGGGDGGGGSGGGGVGDGGGGSGGGGVADGGGGVGDGGGGGGGGGGSRSDDVRGEVNVVGVFVAGDCGQSGDRS